MRDRNHSNVTKSAVSDRKEKYFWEKANVSTLRARFWWMVSMVLEHL